MIAVVPIYCVAPVPLLSAMVKSAEYPERFHGSPAASLGFKINEKVNHKTFGNGKVLKISDDFYEVLFNDGIKKVNQNFLEKV